MLYKIRNSSDLGSFPDGRIFRFYIPVVLTLVRCVALTSRTSCKISSYVAAQLDSGTLLFSMLFYRTSYSANCHRLVRSTRSVVAFELFHAWCLIKCVRFALRFAVLLFVRLSLVLQMHFLFVTSERLLYIPRDFSCFPRTT